MKRVILAVCSVFIALAPAAILAQTASPETGSSPTAQAQSLTQAESFEFLKSLNKAKKIFPESYLLPLKEYKKGVLKPENCFGVRLANGLRLVGESRGADYGVRGYMIDKDGNNYDFFVSIGVLHAEFPFAFEDQLLPAGPYVVEAHQDALALVGDQESKTHYDSFGRKQVPDEVKKKSPLKTPLPEALLAEKAKEIPRFSLAVEKGAIVLTLHGNTWTLVPR